MESGAYSSLWRDVHIGPEQAVLASQLVKAKLLLPVHWGTFNLALHAWDEPIRRIQALAEEQGLQLLAPIALWVALVLTLLLLHCVRRLFSHPSSN